MIDFEVKPQITFLQELNESYLIPSKSHISSYSLKDITDGVFLYFLTLYILKHEFNYAPIVKKYAYRTYMNGHFDSFMTGASDLRIMLTLLIGNNDDMNKHLSDHEANNVLRSRIHVDQTMLRRLLQSFETPKLNDSYEQRCLFNMQTQLCIDNANYRSMRRLIIEWSDLKKHDKQLVMTRLLQAFRARYRKSELLPYLNSLAKQEKLELDNVANAETGEDSHDHEPKKEGNKFLKTLGAIATGMAAGVVYNIIKNRGK